MSISLPVIARINNLCLAYPGRSVLDKLCADIPAGLVLVSGGEGRGKTSLAKILSGELMADSGTIHMQDGSGGAAVLQPSSVYYVDPYSDAFDQMRVDEYIAQLPVRYPAARMADLANLAAGLSLAPHLEKQLFMLSTGTKRKVLMAGGFLANAEVTIFDDPFAALDLASIRFMTEMLYQYFSNNTEKTCIVTGYEEPEGLTFAHHIALGD